MRFFWISFVKDLRLLRRDAAGLAIWFLLPLIVASLIGLVFGRRDAVPQGLLLMADEDAGLAGSFMREAIARGPLGKMLAVQQTGRAEGRARLDRGDGSALLIIPKGFDRAIQHDEPAQIILVTNPEQRILAQIIREAAGGMVDAAHYLQQVAGPELRAASASSIAGLALDAGRTFGGLRQYLYPPLITLKTTVIPRYEPVPTVMALLFPGMVFLVVLLTAEGISLAIWHERASGAVRRLAATPSSIHAFLAAKVAASSTFFLVTIATTFAIGRLAFDVPMRSPAVAVAWTAGCAVVLYLGLLAAELLLANERSATAVASTIVFPLAMLGGSFFPLEIFPQAFARAARMTPNGWMLVQLKSILWGSAAPPKVAEAFAVLALAGALMFFLVGRLVRRRFAM